MMVNAYDLIGTGHHPDRVLAWASGDDVPGLPRLSPAEARILLASWEFNARPGQLWKPGLELITDIEAGRGAGKTRTGSESVAAAAKDPERWGGAAYIGSVDPRAVKRDCLTSAHSGLFPIAERNERAGLGPGIRSINLNDRIAIFEAPRGGGGGGLHVFWGASSDPKSARGPNYGLAWLDEYGVWYHRQTDEQGTNLWRALLPAMRAGPDPKIIITQTPSRAPEVRALQRDAERPECSACRDAYLVACPSGCYDGEPGTEPWRLPTSPQRRLHPLLDTRTTEVARYCPVCRDSVVAQVRAIYGSTTDNPMIAAAARAQARRVLASGTAASRAEFSPRGEADSGARGTLVLDANIVRIEVDVGDMVPDPYAAAVGILGLEEVLVFVDPAVTSQEDSDESGVVAGGLRRIPWAGNGTDPEGVNLLVDQVVGLQDWSVRPSEVEAGSPSSVWSPRAYWLALLWGAERVIVETNQGGDEVLALVRGLVSRPPSEADIAARLAVDLRRPVMGLGGMARRMASVAARLQVEGVSRAANKTARFGWYGETAARGEQALAVLRHTGGRAHWGPVTTQLINYEPPRKHGGTGGGGGGGAKERKDRADALVAVAQVFLGLRELAGGEVHDPRADSWLGKV